MAKVTYECETTGCGRPVDGPDVDLCDTCKARNERTRECRVCGRPFDPASHYGGDEAVCCGSPTLVDFYRGKTLTPAALEWAYKVGGAGSDQRDIALLLFEALEPGEESVSATWESPRHTTWRTEDGAQVHVEFAGGMYSRTTAPVVSIEIGDEYGGLDRSQVQAVLSALISGGSA